MNRPTTVIKALIIPTKYTADNIEAVLDRADITYEWVDLWQESYGDTHRLMSLERDGEWDDSAKRPYPNQARPEWITTIEAGRTDA